MNPYNRFVQRKIKTVEMEPEREDYGWGDDLDFTTCPSCFKNVASISCYCGFICLDCYQSHDDAECVFKTLIGEGFFE